MHFLINEMPTVIHEPLTLLLPHVLDVNHLYFLMFYHKDYMHMICVNFIVKRLATNELKNFPI